MIFRARAVAVFSLLLVLWASSAMAETSAIPDPPLNAPIADTALVQERTIALATVMRCPVCQGLSVEESQSDAAVAMKARIRALVEQGYSDEQIQDYFVERYGVWILLEPPAQGMNWFVWLAPGLAFLVGAALVWLKVRASATTSGADPGSRTAPSETPQPPDSLRDEASGDGTSLDSYRRRILQELDDQP